ncbi:MAG: AI-2E family transporter [Mucilaginibacter polytrichastri]|nr:AI-2E family transporter [Mucilaginibacter polytrichastri]
MKRTTALPFYARLAFVLVSIICIGYLSLIGKEILSPLIFGFLFAILLFPLAGFLEYKLRFPRSVAALVSVILFTIGILLVLYLIGTQISTLAGDFPLLKKQVADSIADLQIWLQETFNLNATKQMNYVHQATEKALSASGAVIGQTVLSLSSMMLFLVFLFIYTFFLIFHRRLLMKFLVSVFDEAHSTTVQEIATHIQYIIKKYIVGLFFQMLIVAALACIVLSILGVKYGILLGVIIGVFNIIPYVGIFSALFLSCLITFATAGASKALIVAVAIFCVHLVDSNYIMPTIVGSKVKINALITVLGVFLGEMLWGISGMFLSIPVIAIMKIVFDRVESLKPWGLLLGDEEHNEKRKKKKVLQDEQPVPKVKTEH